MKTKAPEFVPSVEEYKVAFQTIENRITEKQRSMLKEHYESFCHVTTATDLALLVDYKDFSAANMQYGRLGSMVSQALGLGSLGVITIVLMVPPQQGVINEWLWVMRANVVEALEQLGWVEKKSHLFYPQGGVGAKEYIPE
jgi:hypothetical protein